jgi:hypothetical protein
VEAALLAQTDGFGGCSKLDEIVEQPIRFFPGVRFFEGHCTLEHGALAYPIAGVDSRGLIFVLDAPSAFDFLRRLHPASGVDTAVVVDYAMIALRFMGQSSPRDSLILALQDIADTDLARAGVSREELRPSGTVEVSQSGRIVAITTLGPFYIRTFLVLVYPEGGAARVMTKEEWPLQRE